MNNDGGLFQVGQAKVQTTNNRGLTAEEWAERTLEKIIHVADESDSIIADQARAFKEQIRLVLIAHTKQAIRSDRTTLYNLLIQQGERETAELLRKL